MFGMSVECQATFLRAHQRSHGPRAPGRKLWGSGLSATLGNLWAMTCTHLVSILPNTI